MKRLILVFVICLTPLLPAQTWKTVVPENGTATLPATAAMPITYRYGGLATTTVPAKWCDSVTVTVSTAVTATNGSVTCKVNGVATTDPDPNVVKELDVQEQTTSFTVQTVIGGTKGSVVVPALPAPPPPPPPTGPQTTATVPAPDSASRLYWCDITQPTFTCVPARTDGQ